MIVWRPIVKDLARQLDQIDVAIHRLVVALEQLEQRAAAESGRTKHCGREGNDPDRYHVSGTPPPTPPLADWLLDPLDGPGWLGVNPARAGTSLNLYSGRWGGGGAPPLTGAAPG